MKDVLTKSKWYYLWVILFFITTIFLTGCWTYVNKNAMQAFEARKLNHSVTVYPVNVVKGNVIDHDNNLAANLVTFLDAQGIAKPVLGTNDHTYPFQWGVNQAKMSKQSAEVFAAQVKQDRIQTDYALLVEVLCNPDETNVIGVSYYIVDKEGKIANGCLSNSHWEDFKALKPYNRKGGCEVAKRMLKRYWKGEETTNSAN